MYGGFPINNVGNDNGRIRGHGRKLGMMNFVRHGNTGRDLSEFSMLSRNMFIVEVLLTDACRSDSYSSYILDQHVSSIVWNGSPDKDPGPDLKWWLFEKARVQIHVMQIIAYPITISTPCASTGNAGMALPP
jgi:hypothetical protein